MKFHRTSLTKKYKILFDETVGTNTIPSLFIYIYFDRIRCRISDESNMEIA